jgi:hypothetical protein
MVSNKRYNEMADYYEKEVESLRRAAEDWRNRYFDAVSFKNKAETYEAILAKQGILGESSDHTDKVFVFEGKAYSPTSYALTHDMGQKRCLSVEFEEFRSRL